MYLTYAEYTTMGGTLTEPLFNEISFESETYIDYVSFNRLRKLETIPEEVKKCEFAIIKLVEEKRNLLSNSGQSGESGSQSAGAGISSISNDGVSVSYNNLSASELFKLLSKDEVESTIKRYLANVKDSLGRRVLYRGIYCDDEA